MCETSAFVDLQTIAFVGGENRHSSACVLSLPEGCTRIYIGNERLDLVGKLVDGGLDQIISLDKEVSTDLQLRPDIMEWIGKPGILFTRRGEVFYNNGWLGSKEFVHPIPAGKRRLLRWLGLLPSTLRRNHPDFFVSLKQYIPLN